MKARPAGNPKTNSRGTPTISINKASKAAGLSREQTVQMLRAASVPEEQFEKMVEAAFL